MQLLRVLMLAPLLWLGMIAVDAWQVWHYRVNPPDCAADTAVVMGANSDEMSRARTALASFSG